MNILEQNKDFLRNNDLGLLVLRVALGGLMLFHGVAKAMGGIVFIEGMLTQMGLPAFLAYGALVCEIVAPIMLIIGLWTRVGAAMMAANMIVAILMAHLGAFFAVDPATGGWTAELPALYLLGAVALCFTGGGKYALTHGTLLD